MVMTTKETRKLMNVTKRVLTEGVTPNFPTTLAGSMNKRYGKGLRLKYTNEQLIKLIAESYVELMSILGVDKAKAKRNVEVKISNDKEFIADTIAALK